MSTTITNLPQTVSTAIGSMLQYLFIPDTIEGYEFMIDTLKQKIPAFFAVSEAIQNIQPSVEDNLQWTIHLPPPLDIDVPIADFTIMSTLIDAGKYVARAVMYVMLGIYLLHQFNPKFQVG